MRDLNDELDYQIRTSTLARIRYLWKNGHDSDLWYCVQLLWSNSGYTQVCRSDNFWFLYMWVATSKLNSCQKCTICFWRKAYQMKCTSPRFLDAKYGMSEPDDRLFTDWHALHTHPVSLLLSYSALHHIYVRRSPVYDLCFIFTSFRSSIKVLMTDSLTYATFETCSKRRTHWILIFMLNIKKPLAEWQPLIRLHPKTCRQTAVSGAILV
jgi:hypothetical protein